MKISQSSDYFLTLKYVWELELQDPSSMLLYVFIDWGHLLTPWAVLAPVALLTVSPFSMWGWCLVEAGWEVGAAAGSPLFSWSWNMNKWASRLALGPYYEEWLIYSDISCAHYAITLLWPLLLRTWLCLPAFLLPVTSVWWTCEILTPAPLTGHAGGGPAPRLVAHRHTGSGHELQYQPELELETLVDYSMTMCCC